MNKIKLIILNWCLKNLFNSITEKDILTFNGKHFFVGDKILPVKDGYDIISGAGAMQNFYVWELLVKDMKYQANKMIYEKSKTTDDIVFGKACLFVIDVLEKKIDNLSKIEWKK